MMDNTILLLLSNVRQSTTRILTNIGKLDRVYSMFPLKLKYIMESEDTGKHPGTSHESYTF